MKRVVIVANLLLTITLFFSSCGTTDTTQKNEDSVQSTLQQIDETEVSNIEKVDSGVEHLDWGDNIEYVET